MSNFIEAISYTGLGIYLTGMYYYFSTIEPFCFYLPGGLGRFYQIHKNITTKFDDIVGCDVIKDELRAHLQFFREKKLTKGWMFHGPSGTGKTMMARAIAGESQLPFIEIFTTFLKKRYTKNLNHYNFWYTFFLKRLLMNAQTSSTHILILFYVKLTV